MYIHICIHKFLVYNIFTWTLHFPIVETVEKEMERVENAALQLVNTNQGSVLLPQLQPHCVVQAVKAVCALMGNIETFEITEAVDNFVNACCQFLPQSHTANIECKKPEIIHEDGDYAVVTLRKKFPDVISSHCHKIRDAVQELVETYCHAFRVDFQLNSKGEFPTSKKNILIYIKKSIDWNYNITFFVNRYTNFIGSNRYNSSTHRCFT